MSAEHRKRAAMAVVEVEGRDDQVTPEAGSEFVATPYVQDLSNAPWPTWRWAIRSISPVRPAPARPPWPFTWRRSAAARWS